MTSLMFGPTELLYFTFKSNEFCFEIINVQFLQLHPLPTELFYFIRCSCCGLLLLNCSTLCYSSRMRSMVMVLLNCSTSCSRQSNRLRFTVRSVLHYGNLIFSCVIIWPQFDSQSELLTTPHNTQMNCALMLLYCLQLLPFYSLLLTNLQYTTLSECKLDIWRIVIASPCLSSHKLRLEIWLGCITSTFLHCSFICNPLR